MQYDWRHLEKIGSDRLIENAFLSYLAGTIIFGRMKITANFATFSY